MDTTGRPWEGTALGVIDIVATVGAFIMGILFLGFKTLFAGLGGAAVADAEAKVGGLLSMLGNLGLLAAVIFIALGVLMIFLAIGSFKGQKWTVIANIVFVVLGIISVLYGMINGGSFPIVSSIIYVFSGYCAFKCLKYSYYK